MGNSPEGRLFIGYFLEIRGNTGASSLEYPLEIDRKGAEFIKDKGRAERALPSVR